MLRCRYRIVLSFREDYLPDLRAWEPRLPSLLRQSMRLLPMTRAQALHAVADAGHAVLAEGADQAIVDFVASAPAGGEATVEPVMLSLCCTQLNRRRAPGRRIDAELLRQAGPNIIEDFYDEAMQGLPDTVRHFVEDHLVQGRTRGSYARDEAIAQGFIDAAQLERLSTVHRLLRVDPAGDVPRIELIHDRLVDVVRRARDARRAQAQAQAAREREDLQRQRRARRWIATALGVVSVLAVVAVSMALLAFNQRSDAVGAREQAEQSARELASALERTRQAEAAASAEAAAARQRLQEVTLLARYGWTGQTDSWLIDNAVQADAGIRQLQQGGGAAAQARRQATVLEIWTKQVDAAKVRDALSALGFAVRARPALLPDDTNALWFGAPVHLDDVKLVALALMRAGIQVRAIRPLQSYLASRGDLLVQAGASRDANGCKPWRAQEVVQAAAFTRGADPCQR